MMDVTVKTLDGQVKNFSVPENITVKEFKQKVANSISISADTQRLIFQGRVLQDDKQLKFYDVHGKVIHAVQKVPPTTRPSATAAAAMAPPTSAPPPLGVNDFVMESFAIPNGMFPAGNDQTGIGVHINVQAQQISPALNAERRIANIRKILRLAENIIKKLENSDTSSSESSTVASPMDTSEGSPSEQATVNAQSPPDEPLSTAGQTQGATSTQGTTPSRNASQQPAALPVLPSLGSLIHEVSEVNSRLQPFIQEYEQVLKSDPDFTGQSEGQQKSQRLCDLVLEAMHHIGHCYHGISDFSTPLEQPRPRHVRCPQAQMYPFPEDFPVPLIPPGAAAPHAPVGTPAAPSTTASTGSTQGSPTSTSGARTSSASGTTPSFGASTNPYMFVEVRPGTVTVNSFTAHIMTTNTGPESNPTVSMVNTTSTATTTTASTAPSASTNTTPGQNTTSTGTSTPRPGAAPQPNMGNMGMPDFLNNIIHSVQQSMMQGGNVMGQPINIGPRPPGAPGQPALRVRVVTNANVANSNQAAGNTTPATSVQTSTSATQSTQSATSRSTNTSSTGNVTSSQTRPTPTANQAGPEDRFLGCRSRHFPMHQNTHNPFSRLMASFDGDLMEQPVHVQRNPSNTSSPRPAADEPTPQSGAAPQPSAPPQATIFSGMFPGSFGMTPPTAGGQAGPQPQFSEMLRDVLRSSSGEAPQSADGSTPLTDEGFTQLVQGISSSMSQALMGFSPNSNETISDFLGNIGNNITPGEGIVNEAFQCISQHLTIIDLMNVFYGRPECLDNLRAPLREFVQDRILEGQEFSRSVTDRIIQSMEQDTQNALAGADVIDGVDMPNTLLGFFRHHLYAMLAFILEPDANSPDGPSYGRRLYDMCHRLLCEFVILCRTCLVGGIPALDVILQDRLRAMTSDINPMIQQWMSRMTTEQLTQFTTTIHLPDDAVTHYIARLPEAMPVSQPSLAPTQVPDPVREVIPESREPRPDPVTNGTSSPTEDTEDWKTIVPTDWVPVIDEDMQRQKKQNSHEPFSDAYLNGMPPKRRRMMTQDRPADNITTVEEFIPESLQRAVEAVGVQPISSLENLVTEARADERLHQAFEQQMRDTITDRLSTDVAATATEGRYPKTKEYFTDKKEK